MVKKQNNLSQGYKSVSSVNLYGNSMRPVKHQGAGGEKLEYTLPKLRRSNSLGRKAAIIETGRSPTNPFVNNYRQIVRKNSSQIFHFKRTLSPADKKNLQNMTTYLMDERRSVTKADISQYTSPRKYRISHQSSQDKQGGSSSHSTTPLHPEDIFNKYKDFPVNSLKVSEYKETTLRIVQTIGMIKEIKPIPTIKEHQKIDFKFKKAGFTKLLLLDLDETLIHTQRDQDECDEEMLMRFYGPDYHDIMDMEPDEKVEMCSPDGDYEPFE